MKPSGRILATALSFFVIGTALPTLLVWNPGQWEWAHRLVGHLHSAGSQTPIVEGGRLWTCGMHPQVVQNEPGNCPICGMRLVPVKDQGVATTAPAQKERKVKYWRAPMDPNYISDQPGKSPMGMDLIPVYEDEETVAGGIRVDPGFLQNFSIRTAPVTRGSIPILIRTIGILNYNEKHIVSVNTKFEGWIEKAHVNYVGEQVAKGQVLFEIYSPQLVTTQQEYLATRDYLDRLEGRADTDAVARARSLLQASRERLRYWDITDDQIDALGTGGRITRTLKILSPAAGVVIEKMGDSLEGMKLMPGMNVYKIANLANVWAEVEVFEYQIQYLQLGRSAKITVDAFPGRQWTGRIIYIDPTVKSKTRTLKAYVEIPNPGHRLRPEMFANVEINVPAVSGALIIPEEAILHSGARNVVIVQKDKGIFEPREVELGAMGGGYREVRKGLHPDEIVVTSSQFLIDSESNLKEAISKVLAARSGEPQPKTEPQHNHNE